MKCFKIFILSLTLVLALGLAMFVQKTLATEATEDVSLDEDIEAEDLGISEPKLLPDNPFYFLKNWGRSIRSFFAFNPITKAELKEKFTDERLIELKMLIEQNRNREEIEEAIQNYQKELGEMEKVTQKIKERAEENEKVGAFLDKFIQHQVLHQRILQKLEDQVPPEVFEKIETAREEHLKKFGEVMNRLENKERLQERLEQNLEKVKGSEFKDFKNLEILKDLKENVPEEAKGAIKQAEENALKILKEDLEEMDPVDREKFVDYVEKISGDSLKHLDILKGLEGEELSEELEDLIERAEEKNIEEIEEEYSAIPKEKVDAQIKKAEDSLKTVQDLIANYNLETNEIQSVYRLVSGATEKLEDAKEALQEGEYGRAFGQAVASESLSRNAIRIIEMRTGFEEGTSTCNNIQKTVCGTDRKIYQNICLAKQTGAKIAYFGECQDLLCGKEGEKINRNPLLGPVTQVCCSGLEEVRISKSYSVCQKEGFETPCSSDEDCPLSRCPGLNKPECIQGRCVTPRCENPVICIQVITPAKNPSTGKCEDFPTPCDVPSGWEIVDKCPTENSNPED